MGTAGGSEEEQGGSKGFRTIQNIGNDDTKFSAEAEWTVG